MLKIEKRDDEEDGHQKYKKIKIRTFYNAGFHNRNFELETRTLK
jgi:hypothetical protein